ncbi:ROK family protein [Spiroplasma clarkii]|uniref:Glucokinase n=1 Tax=Spiroplasma clarkii TaxID=2139 RepID=A0A2K8KJC1_9MOLU|nr:ROK family protein [Spiroplasma clarkii]ATX70429.1 glucokinase [Spiroplasma clarkii]
MEKYYLAVDLGGTSAKCAVIHQEQIIKRFTVPTKIGEVIENIHQTVTKEIVDLQITTADFQFIGFTICGLIDYEKGISLWSGNLQWENYEVVKEIKRIFQNPHVFILNDSKAATYGEYVGGINQEKPNVLFYTIGTGIGGGVILNHQLYFGNHTKLASEPGHGGGFQNLYQCNCGLQGCVEGLSSATGIEKQINKNRDYFCKKLNLDKSKLTIKDIAPLFYAKDKVTMDLFKIALAPLANHIAVSLHLLDFDIVIIGGGPCALGDDLLVLLKELLKQSLLPAFYEKLDLRIAKLENDAGIWGIYHFAKNLLK